MPSCCYADEYGELFPEGTARRTARSFLRRGLRGTSRTLADELTGRGLHEATVLEVGGGAGELHVELLRRGAAQATNVELSPSWEAAASGLLNQLGLRDRVQRRVADFVDVAAALPESDMVVLHRVICCYPDWRAMLDAATGRARRVIGITLPVDRWSSRVAVAVGNGFLRLRKRSFRAHVHPWDEIVAVLAADGFRVVADRRGVVWRTMVVERPGPQAA